MISSDGHVAELDNTVVDYSAVRRRARRLIARTDPILANMARLVDAVIERGDITRAADSICAFYLDYASVQAGRIERLSAFPASARVVRIEVERRLSVLVPHGSASSVET